MLLVGNELILFTGDVLAIQFDELLMDILMYLFH